MWRKQMHSARWEIRNIFDSHSKSGFYKNVHAMCLYVNQPEDSNKTSTKTNKNIDVSLTLADTVTLPSRQQK